ncbi:MAG: hypothetical protein U0271_24715 [Polyangiaceae bacterium]
MISGRKAALLFALSCAAGCPNPDDTHGGTGGGSSSSTGASGASGGNGGRGGEASTSTSMASSVGGSGGATQEGARWSDPIWAESFLGDSASARALAVAPTGTSYVCATFDGVLTVDATTFSSAERALLFLAFDQAGALVVARQIDAPGANCAGLGVQPDGTVIAIGTFTGQLDFGGGALSADGEDVFVAAFDAALAPTWSEQFGGAGDQRALDAAVAADGSVILGGHYDGVLDFGAVALPELVGASLPDGFVAKLDPIGAGLWATSIGGALLDEVRAVAVDGQTGEIALAGRAYGTFAVADGPPVTSDASQDGFVARLTSDGGYVFDHRLAISPFEPCAVAPTSDGGLVLGFAFGGEQALGGVVLSAPGLEVDVAVARFDASGEPVAARELEARLPPGALEPFPPEESVRELFVDELGRIVLTGHDPAGLDFGGGPSERRGMFVAALTPELEITSVELHTVFSSAFGVAVAPRPGGGVVAFGDGWTDTQEVLLLAALSL